MCLTSSKSPDVIPPRMGMLIICGVSGYKTDGVSDLKWSTATLKSSKGNGNNSGSLPFYKNASLTLNGSQRPNRHAYSHNSCKEQSNVGKVFGSKQSGEIAFRVIFCPILLLAGCLFIYYVHISKC